MYPIEHVRKLTNSAIDLATDHFTKEMDEAIIKAASKGNFFAEISMLVTSEELAKKYESVMEAYEKNGYTVEIYIHDFNYYKVSWN